GGHPVGGYRLEPYLLITVVSGGVFLSRVALRLIHGFFDHAFVKLQALAFAVKKRLLTLEGQTSDRDWKVRLVGDVIRIGFGLRLRIERGVVAEEAVRVSVRHPFVLQASALPLRDRILSQPEDEQTNVRQIVTALRSRRPDAAHVNRVTEFVERPVNQIERVDAAQINRAPPGQFKLVQRLSESEQPVELNRSRRPA